MNSEILKKKNWEPEEIRKSQLNDNKLNSYTAVYQIKKEKPNWNQVSPIKVIQVHSSLLYFSLDDVSKLYKVSVIMHLHCCVAYLEMIIKVCSHSLFH
jgi:hypothetical protein